MSILIDSNTTVLVQGITGSEGTFWTKHMKNYRTNIVAGVTPGKEGQDLDGIPVYNTVRRAVKDFRIDATVLFVPPRFAKDALYEALDSGIRKVVILSEGIPVHDTVQMRKAVLETGAVVLGGNTTGIISIDKAMMGFFFYWLDRVYRKGTVGVMTRSGSLTNEVTAEIVKAGFGTSSVIGIGGDAVPCTRFAELLPLFESDPETQAVVMIGEIGGTMEEEVAETIRMNKFTKPLVAFFAGRNAPKGMKMGHAGAIISAGKGTVADKIQALQGVGALVAQRPSAVGQLLQGVLRLQSRV